MRVFLNILLLVCLFICYGAYANVPPGLQKKGVTTIPSFLGKTPPGWDEGVKRGWDKNKNWHWNKKTKLWENKNWKWNSNHNEWKRK